MYFLINVILLHLCPGAALSERCNFRRLMKLDRFDWEDPVIYIYGYVNISMYGIFMFIYVYIQLCITFLCYKHSVLNPFVIQTSRVALV